MQGAIQIHGRSVLLGLLLLGALSAWQSRTSIDAQKTIVDIAIEHSTPAKLELTFTVKGNVALFDVAVKSSTGTRISIPSSWERTQVQNVPLASVTDEEGALGFRRWFIPPLASVRFGLSAPVDGVRLLNPSRIPLDVTYRRIDVLTKEVEEHSALFYDTHITLP